MPKLYEYFGLIIMFYANEHEPVHVHGKSQGRESRAEIIVLNGIISEIRYSAVAGRASLDINEMRYFEEIVSARRRHHCQVDRLLCTAQIHHAGTHHEETQMTPATINIVTADQVGDFRLRLKFDDGTEQTVDFKPFLSHALHPDLRAWLDPVRFATFRLEYGELVWGDYDLCFPVMDLYRNQIELHAPLESVA